MAPPPGNRAQGRAGPGLMDREEIRLRRLAGQRLIAPEDKLSAARSLCGVQAQFMSNALHALRIRCSGFDEGAAADGLVKNWTLRGTVHVFAESDLPLFIRAEDYRKNEWSAPNWWNSRPDWVLTPERQRYLSDVVLAALGEGARTREELKETCRAEGMTPEEEQSMFHPWGGGVRQLCERGFMHYAASERKEFRLTPVLSPCLRARRSSSSQGATLKTTAPPRSRTRRISSARRKPR